MPVGFRVHTSALSCRACHFAPQSARFEADPAGSRSMEMHQVRYFLAVAQLLNFTRAAEECNVTQPSLTRAIKQLEAELGGDLFRRERPAAQLTELGQRMHPLLKQCYDAAAGARSLASSFRSGEIGALRIALTHSIDLALLIPHLNEIKRQFNRLEFRFLRGSNREVGDFLKKGEAELGIATEIDEVWDRLDVWPLFTENFELVIGDGHRLAGRASVDLDDLRSEQLLSRTFCEHARRISASLREHGIDIEHGHEVSNERDLIELVEADIGIAMVPHSSPVPERLTRAAVAGLDARRTVNLYGVAGRQRTAVGNAVMRMLRGADWREIAG
ncbi:LysR family transcriptional regulator [Bradyrhizobium sp. CCBAU 51765]|nr:LysR family transcriptional regulator [Bradyrhizobium sp. CCBAU 51765]